MSTLDCTEHLPVAARWKCPAAKAYITTLAAPQVQCSNGNGPLGSPKWFAACVDAPKKKACGVYIFDTQRLHPVHTLRAEGMEIPADLAFLSGHASTEHLLLTGGADGASRLWDLRASTTAAQRIFQVSESVSSITVDANGSKCACATGTEVHAFDVAGGRKVFVHGDAHSEPISRLRFHPQRTQELVTSGDDGLLCALDTQRCELIDGPRGSQDDTEDAGLRLVINNGEGVRSFSLLGEGADLLCTISTTEVLQMWSLHPKRPGALCGSFPKLRADSRLRVGESDGYIVDALYDRCLGCAHVLGGAVDGSLAVFHLNLEGAVFSATLEHSHTGVVRAIASLGSMFVTGGEDGTLCMWSNMGQPSTASLSSGHTDRPNGRHNAKRTKLYKEE